jgi:flagellar biosynthesis/type III secretory pathway protein FliH
MDEHTSHELAYKKGYDKGYNKGYADALEYAMSCIDDIKRDVNAILKNVQAVQRLAKQEPEPPKGE